ncbi:MAG: hypothetical protein WD271_01190 [Acidimicrobiia bacterium]
MPTEAFQDIEVAVSVMAYPAISSRHGEVVCVAGFRHDTLWQPDWVRLFPFRVRDVPADLRVHKWDTIRLRARKSTSDERPESFTPDMDSIRVVGHIDTKHNWQARKALVEPHRGRTMRQVLMEHASTGTSLAVVETGRILDLEVSPRPARELEEAREKAAREVAQGDLFSLDDRQALEPIPFDFHFVVQYPDDDESRRLKVIDWEINQAYRNYRRGYADPEQRVRDRWLNDVCGPKNDPVFLVGNQHRFPDQWLLLGIVWPRRA